MPRYIREATAATPPNNIMVAAVMTAEMAAPDRQIENNEPVVMAATMMAVASLPTIQMRRVVAMAELLEAPATIRSRALRETARSSVGSYPVAGVRN